jgi:regulator of chromosome condensation
VWCILSGACLSLVLNLISNELNRDKKVCGISCGGLHNAVFTEEGLVYTWGCADDGSLGRPGDETTPLLVEALASETIINVACGDCQTIAVSTDGSVWGWGCYRDKEGTKWFNPEPEAPVPSKDISKQQNTPIRIVGLSGVIEVVCSSVCNIARCTDGRLYSWGIGESGELGRDVPPLTLGGPKKYNLEGILKHHVTPGPMHIADDMTNNSCVAKFAKAIGCGSYHSLVVLVRNVSTVDSKSDQHSGVSVLACGLNNYGQLGLGDTINRSILHEIVRLENVGVISVAGGAHHSLVLTAKGQIFAFGRGDSGQVSLMFV